MAQAAETAMAARRWKKKDVSRALGLREPSEFSRLLGCYREWPIDVKVRLIQLLALEDILITGMGAQ